MSLRLDKAVADLKMIMVEDAIDVRNGLPLSLFKFASSLSPIPNVDLFVVDSHNRFLLAWRDDEYYGQGWHIPGGCIRLLESLETRIQKTAIDELGENVIYDKTPLMIVEALASEERIRRQGNFERTHNICILYKCRFSKKYDIEVYNRGKEIYQKGYLKWFDQVPENFLHAQIPIYRKFLENWVRTNYECNAEFTII